jgi:crotonobetainyl-CoA:carnitine CoA-transferase CaiB-like acyl-CoA transferase
MGATAAYDDVIQAASGLAMLQGMVTGEPRCVPTVVADKIGSNAVVSAVLAALYEREKSGRGQAIEVPMFETVVAFLMIEHLYGQTFVQGFETMGYKRLLNSARGPYRSKDGYIALLPYTDANWRELCGLIGRPELLTNPRFQSVATRPCQHRVDLLHFGRNLPDADQRRMAGAARWLEHPARAC